MTISEAYQKTLKRRAIVRFVQENERSPTAAELRDIIASEQGAYPSVDDVGISGFDIHKPQFKEFSSSELENTNRNAIFDDMETLLERTDDLIELLEDSFRGWTGTSRRTRRLLSQLESRIDNLLLLNRDTDAYVYGIEEDFETQENLDLLATTAAVESNYVTIGRTGYSVLDLSDVKIKASTLSEKARLGTQSSSNIDLLKEEDGSFWEHLVYTKSRQGRVSLVLELELPDALYVNDLRLTGSPVAVNGQSTITVFYSLDNQTFTELNPIERVFSQGEMHFSMGIEGVRKIRILISKSAADNITTTGSQHVYVFSLDSLKIYTDVYVPGRESILFAGPYEVTDEFGAPVNFTKATCTACLVEPEDTSVSFFLSKDGVNYTPVNVKKNASSVVSFANGSKVGTFSIVDLTLGVGALVESIVGVQELDFANEALINTFITSEFSDFVPIRSMVVKRNVRSPLGVGTIVYKTTPGWFLDVVTAQYSTTIQIDAPEGRRIDFGSTGIKVNGTLLTGEVHLKTGLSEIVTSDGNWYEVPGGLTTVDELIAADPLYPYNHKYLVEGYVYPTGFVGERIYNGADDYFGKSLTFVAPERFNSPENDNDLGIFTLEDSDGNLYFKVKVDKTDASWQQELYDVDWVVQSDENNLIYVKAILASSSVTCSPIIEDFKVRVI